MAHHNLRLRKGVSNLWPDRTPEVVWTDRVFKVEFQNGKRTVRVRLTPHQMFSLVGAGKVEIKKLLRSRPTTQDALGQRRALAIGREA